MGGLGAGHLFTDRRLEIAAHPNSHRDSRRKSDKPGVGVQIGGPCFASEIRSQPAGAGAGTALDNALQHVQGKIGHCLRHNALAVREVSFLKPLVAVKNLRNEVWLGDLSEVCNPRVGTYQIDQPNAEGAERKRRIGVELGADAELTRCLDNRSAARQLLQLDRRGVVAGLQGPPQGGDAVVLLIVIFRAIGELTSAVGKEEGRIEDGVCRCEAMLEGGQIDEGFERRTALERRLDRAVELGALKIETADQGKNRARAVVHRDQRSLDLRFLQQIHHERFLRLLWVFGFLGQGIGQPNQNQITGSQNAFERTRSGPFG